MEELKIGIEVLEVKADELRCDIAHLFYTGSPSAWANDEDLFQVPAMVEELKITLGKIEALKTTLEAVISNDNHEAEEPKEKR